MSLRALHRLAGDNETTRNERRRGEEEEKKRRRREEEGASNCRRQGDFCLDSAYSTLQHCTDTCCDKN